MAKLTRITTREGDFLDLLSIARTGDKICIGQITEDILEWQIGLDAIYFECKGGLFARLLFGTSEI